MPGHGSGTLVWSSSLLIRGILAAFGAETPPIDLSEFGRPLLFMAGFYGRAGSLRVRMKLRESSIFFPRYLASLLRISLLRFGKPQHLLIIWIPI
jgi:hypothetical protein